MGKKRRLVDLFTDCRTAFLMVRGQYTDEFQIDFGTRKHYYKNINTLTNKMFK